MSVVVGLKVGLVTAARDDVRVGERIVEAMCQAARASRNPHSQSKKHDTKLHSSHDPAIFIATFTLG